MNKKRIGDLLISLRLITQQQLDQALEKQKTEKLPLGSILVKLGFLTEDLLLNALAAQIGVWPWKLEELPPEPEAVKKVPADVCKKHVVLPVSIRGDLLLVATLNPHDFEALDAVRTSSGMRIEAVLADATRLLNAIEQFHGQTKTKSENVDALVERALRDYQLDPNARRATNQLSEVDTRPVVGLVNQIISDAIKLHASDVHIEPRSDLIEVRYRIDGQLQTVRTIPSALAPMLTTRMKILAEIDIVETRVPQDGRIGVEVEGRSVDLRVSVLPSQHGGRIVMRILDRHVGVRTLEQIGFAEQDLTMFRNLVSKPYGLFLVTGPTGSGKTTTLYAALMELRDGTNNVITCEDPIEYEIDGVSQSQVNERVGLTFAKQLRAILRQDPDVILVGEVRDSETAVTAVRAALTGHMVLSTLHCNDAPSALPRLWDMEIDPYLLSTTLIGVMSQRLLRTVCPDCCQTEPITPEVAAFFDAYGVPVPLRTVVPRGCNRCGGDGWKGRAAVHEILPITPAVASLVAKRAPVEEIAAAGEAYGYRPMQKRALELVAEGKTTMAEAKRVVFFDLAFARAVADLAQSQKAA